MVFFFLCSRIQSRIPFCIYFHVSLVCLGLWQFWGGTSQLLCRTPLKLESSGVFLLTRLRGWIFGKNTTKGKGLSHGVDTQYPCDITSDINFYHLIRSYLPCFTRAKVLFLPPPPYSILRKQVTKSIPHSKGRVRLNSTSWWGSIFKDHIGILFFGISVFLPSLTYISVDSHILILYFAL